MFGSGSAHFGAARSRLQIDAHCGNRNVSEQETINIRITRRMEGKEIKFGCLCVTDVTVLPVGN